MPAKKKSAFRKFADKASRKITKAVGAKNLAKYAGETLARRKNKSIKRTVTGKQALKSAGSLASVIAPIGAVGVLGKVAKLANKTRKANKVRKVAKAKKLSSAVAKDKSEKAFIKRTYSGHENLARRQAKKRVARRKLKI